MPDQPNPTPDAGSGDPFADVPLFREIQRLLTGSRGPVNWELARQMALASAAQAGPDAASTPADLIGFQDAVRIAELQIATLTKMPAPTEIAIVETVRRAQWVEAAATDLRGFVEPAAQRLADGMASLGPEVLGRETDDLSRNGGGEITGESDQGGVGGGNPFANALGQVVPLLLGMQTGAVLGRLAHAVLGRYDIAVPRSDAERLEFVVPNIVAFEKNWSLPPIEFRQWLALHEVAHRFEFARPWIAEHLAELLRDFLSTLEIDPSELEQQLQGIDPMGDPAGMQDFLEGDAGFFGPVLDGEQQLKLARIQSFLAIAEGFGDHLTHTLGAQMFSSYAKIDEAMRRYREDEPTDPVFARLLGIEFTREHAALGRTFCDAVATQSSEAALGGLWDSADTLPSMPELREPMLWMARSI